MENNPKTCRKCGEQKPLSEYYKHPTMADGHSSMCKSCRSEYAIAYGKSKHGKAVIKKANSDPKRRDAFKKNIERWRKNNPHKRRAHSKVSNSLRAGKIERPSECSSCGDTGKIHGHHDDYSKPLEVIWLCPSCHRERHRQIGFNYEITPVSLREEDNCGAQT
jgi:hypothetical protein